MSNIDPAVDLLRHLRQRAAGPEDLSCLLVVAHPDDETISASVLLRYVPKIWLVQVTDGAPLNMADAYANGFATREDYAAGRRQETCAVLRQAGIAMERFCNLGFVDQRAIYQVIELADRLEELLRRWRPRLVVTHAYEGGHPDHDATALAMRVAMDRLADEAPALVEMASYHNCATGIRTLEFLPHGLQCSCLQCGCLRCSCLQCPSEVTVLLSEEECAFKRSLLTCYASQQQVLQYFLVGVERFREAPRYDFVRPPHPGQLFYERFDWGMTGERWRALAAEALQPLNLHEVL